MREQLCTLLALHAGQTIDQALAVKMVHELFPDRTFEPAQFAEQQYRGLIFRVERFRDIEDEIRPLHEAHWLETEGHRHGFTMKPDCEAFKASEQAGRLIQFTARSGGKLVGSIRMYLFTSLHTGTLAAREDTFFMLPEHRQGFCAIRFWQFMERCLAAAGVKEITTDSKVINQVGRLNEYLGYTHVANVFHKLLGE